MNNYQTEKYEVVPPPPQPIQPFRLTASGVEIADVIVKDEFIFVQHFDQKRFFVTDLIEGIMLYAISLNRAVQYVLWDVEYERFEFKTYPLHKGGDT